MSQVLFHGLKAAGNNVVCMEACHMSVDARGIAHKRTFVVFVPKTVKYQPGCKIIGSGKSKYFCLTILAGCEPK